MATYSNGINTRETILQTARELFYEQGYRQTTTRQIVSRSSSNLGLIKYHFNSKADIGLAVYGEINDAICDWSASLASFTTPAERLMLASTAEIKLSFTSPEFGRFFNELYEEPKVLNQFMDNLHEIIPKTFRARIREIDAEHTLFIELCLLGAKTNLIRYVAPFPESAGHAERYLQDHIRLHAELLNTPDMDETTLKCMDILEQYDFLLHPGMVPEVRPHQPE